MSTETLKWTDPLPAAEIASVDLYDATGGANEKIGSVAGGVQTFTTGVLAAGTHAFTAIVVPVTGLPSVPSNTVTQDVAAATPPITDLSGTFNP